MRPTCIMCLRTYIHINEYIMYMTTSLSATTGRTGRCTTRCRSLRARLRLGNCVNFSKYENVEKVVFIAISEPLFVDYMTVAIYLIITYQLIAF